MDLRAQFPLIVAGLLAIASSGCDSGPMLALQRATLPDGTHLAYSMLGHGPDTAVVLHGGPGLQMEYLVREWAPLAEGRTLVLYDQRGRGRSDSAPDSLLSASADADDLESLRAALGLGRFDLAAHHSGATVAALYARRHPEHVRRLLLVSPGFARRSYLFWAATDANDSAATARVTRAIQAHENTADPAGFCHRFWGFWFSPVEVIDPVVIRRLAPGICAATPERLLSVDRINDRMFRAAYGLNLRDSLATIQTPTLIIQGAGDSASMSSARSWASWLPEGRELVIPGVRAALFPWIDHEESFFAATNQFLSGRWPDGALRPAESVDSVTTTSLVK